MHTTPRLLLDSLKRCPLCEAVNAEASEACFVCGWTGAFERDADGLKASFDDLVARCPELSAMRPKRKSWLNRLTRRVDSLLRSNRTRSASSRTKLARGFHAHLGSRP